MAKKYEESDWDLVIMIAFHILATWLISLETGWVAAIIIMMIATGINCIGFEYFMTGATILFVTFAICFWMWVEDKPKENPTLFQTTAQQNSPLH